MADDLNGAAQLLWQQAQQQLSQQSNDLDTLRTRAVAMLSVASIIAGLFGTRLPHGHSPLHKQIALTVALVLFAASVIAALVVAAPRKRWIFTFKLQPLVQLVDEGRAQPMDISSNLADWANDALHSNAGKLNWVYTAFGWLCVLVGGQVIAWAIAVL
jgi:hypothetical protein